MLTEQSLRSYLYSIVKRWIPADWISSIIANQVKFAKLKPDDIHEELWRLKVNLNIRNVGDAIISATANYLFRLFDPNDTQ